MKSINKFKNVLPLLLGIVTTLICISLCVFMDMYTDISIESFSVLFVIPLGAIILGAICGCGLICSLRILNIRIKFKHYIISSILGVVGFIGIYIGLYIAITQKYGIIISVNEFLDKIVLNRVTTFSVGSNISRPYKMGTTYGVIETIIELIGFIIGGFVIGFFMLGNTKFCDKCDIYMKNKNMYFVRANNPERIFTEIKDAIKSEELLYNYVCDNKKESKHEKKMARKYKDPYFNIGLTYCNNCFDGFIIIRLMKKNGSSYSEEVRQLIRISKNSVTELLKVL